MRWPLLLRWERGVRVCGWLKVACVVVWIRQDADMLHWRVTDWRTALHVEYLKLDGGRIC